jgi:phage repressor protein C with HTH and peptisase S24 domain
MQDETPPSTPSDRLRAARGAAGFKSATAAAEKLKVPLGTYAGHENGARAFDVAAAKKYALAFGVRAAWLLTGEPPQKGNFAMHSGADVEEALVRVPLDQWDPAAPEPEHDRDERAIANGIPYEPQLPGGRPEIDVRPGAGEGSIGAPVVALTSHGAVTGHKVVGEWVVPDAFYRHELQAHPSSSVFMPVLGDSMSPTLHPGDRVIVDTKQNVFGVDGLYVFDDGDSEPRIKRLSKVLFSKPESVTIISDNPIHPPQTVPLSDMRILGRVVGRVSKL